MAKFWTESTPWLISASEAFSKIRKRCATRFCWVFGVRSDMYARMPSTTLGGTWKRASGVNRICAYMSWYALDVSTDTQAWSAGADVKRPTMFRMQKWKCAIGKARWVGMHPQLRADCCFSSVGSHVGHWAWALTTRRWNLRQSSRGESDIDIWSGNMKRQADRYTLG